jgi:hypothetical protein
VRGWSLCSLTPPGQGNATTMAGMQGCLRCECVDAERLDRHMALAMAAHACLTVLHARQLDAGNPETGPPTSPTSASPGSDD